MKILMIVNWKIEYCKEQPRDKQPPDFYIENQNYWFYKYFSKKPEVDVIDISSFRWLENFEKKILHFYVWQQIKAITKLRKYDLVVSHGYQSGVIVALWRKFFKSKCKHIVFDIGCFNSGAEKGFVHKLMQITSKSVDGIIYHMSSQLDYYKKFFPWIVDKSRFVRYGVDIDFFQKATKNENSNKYFLCVGKSKSNWEFVYRSFKEINNDNFKLYFVGGHVNDFDGDRHVIQFDYLPINQLKELINGAYACILPLNLTKFSFGQMRLLQQMSMGKCVIASRIPSLIDYAIDNENILFYEPNDYEDFKRIIYKVMNDSVLVKKIAANAAGFVKNNMSEEFMAKKVEEFFYDVLKINS